MWRHIGLSVALAAIAMGQDYPFVLRTIAGNLLPGDGGPATQAVLQTANAAILDAQGQLHILDGTQKRIRFVDSSGNISTSAVLGAQAYDIRLAPDEQSYIVMGADQLTRVTLAGATSLLAGRALPGDDDAAAGAPINTDAQSHIMLDPAGNIYVAETEAHRVRRFDVDGKVRLIAGTGKEGFSGDGGLATQAQLYMPSALAYDASSGALYIADSWNHRVRRVTREGTITTVVGTGQYYFPNDGPALQVPIGIVSALALDPSGNLYVGDGSYGLVLKVTPAGALAKIGGLLFQQTPLSDGKAMNSVFQSVLSLAADARGNVYVTDRTARVRRLGSDGSVVTVAGQLHFAGDGGKATAALLNYPRDVDVDSIGNVYIADSSNNRVRRVAPDGTISTLAGNGELGTPPEGATNLSSQPLPGPFALAVDPRDDSVYVAQLQAVYRIAKGAFSSYAGNGGYGASGDGGPARAASFSSLGSIAIDATGNMYIMDIGANRLRKVSATDGKITNFAGTGEHGFSGDGGLATEAKINSATNTPSVVVDRAGNVYFADFLNQRIRRVAPNGIITTIAGNGLGGEPRDGDRAALNPIGYPMGLAIDRNDTLYISTLSGRIYALAPDNTIRRIAGGGEGEIGEGVAAMDVASIRTLGTRADRNGDLYIAMEFSNEIRKLIRNSPASLEVKGGDGQSASAGTALPLPIRVLVQGRGGVGVAGVPVTFAVPSGNATLENSTVISDADGVASATLRLTGAPGRVAVEASFANLPAARLNATATVCLDGVPSIDSVRFLKPSSYVEIKGSNLASVTREWRVADFAGDKPPSVVEGTRVLLNGQEVSVSYVSPTQVNALLASSLTSGLAQVTVENCTGKSQTITVDTAANGN